MEINDFLKSTQRLEKYYDKEYTEEQTKIMYDRLKNLSSKEFNRAIDIVLDECKFLPKIADIKNALIQPNNTVTNKEEISFIKCEKCINGFIKYFKDIKDGERILKYDFIALCTCENGRKQKEINGYKLPFITEIGL